MKLYILHINGIFTRYHHNIAQSKNVTRDGTLLLENVRGY